VIEKLLPLIVYPVGIAILLGLAAFVLSFFHSRRFARLAILAAVGVLWASATPLVASLLTGWLERDYPPTSLNTAPSMEVAVVLGGGISQPRLAETELGPAGDRVFQAYLLWRTGKAGIIVVSGGNSSWDAIRPSEASLAARTMVAMGVPAEAIITETESVNTRQNALNVARVWNEQEWQSGYLVTSAAHMPRALAAFRMAGLDLEPWPADYKGGDPVISNVLDVLPDAGALELTTAAIKEFLGITIYRLRGWL
jgi:uncharacterized SAM-binding protein YcdF (DUF218 family)